MTRSNTNYRTAMVAPTPSDSIREAHSYEYDNNGNILYVNTSRVKPDMTTQPDTVQRAREERFRWDEENRLTALSQNVTKEPCHTVAPGANEFFLVEGACYSVYRKKQNNTIVDIPPSNTSKQIHVVPLNVFEKIRKRIEVGSSTGEIK